MKIIYAHDNIYYEGKDGLYSAGQFSYSYWHVYLEAFGTLTVLGRKSPQKATKNMERSDGKGVSIKTFPNMNSLSGKLIHKKDIVKALEREMADADGVIIRAMSEIGWEVYKLARKHNLPIVHELSGCPWDNTWNHGSLSAKLYAPLRYLRARKVARTADQVLYVTRDFLPKRYPATGQTVIASNVRISKPSKAVLDVRLKRMKRVFEKQDIPLRFGLIGHLDHKLKGIDIAIEAFAEFLKTTQQDASLHILGPGAPTPYKELAQKLGISKHVFFDGTLKGGDPVLKWLDEIDVYLQPSYHEGLPRALIEAMSRGALALASTAGGIAELLPEDFLHKPGDKRKLARDMVAMTSSPLETLQNKATANFKTTQNYTNDILAPKRAKFWSDFAKRVKKYMKAS